MSCRSSDPKKRWLDSVMSAEHTASPPTLREPTLSDWLWGGQRRRWLETVRARLRQHATLRELRADPFWEREGTGVLAWLSALHAGAPGEGRGPRASACRAAPPAAHSVLRVVHWNIFKGIALEAILAALRDDPELRDPDVLLLNEVDVGMARSGNRHIAAELGAQLGMHWAFAPSYLELTKGPGAEALVPGENEVGLHGVAVLTRQMPLALAAVDLPECFDMYAFEEKRLGGRRLLLAVLPGNLMVGSLHLEVRGRPTCRAHQMKTALEGITALERREEGLGRRVARVLLGGDLNTHTFTRGSLACAARGLARILSHSRGGLVAQLMEPWRGGREPLFRELQAAGFAWESLNDRRPTASEILGRVEELERLPSWARALLVAGLGPRRLPLRLDWFCGRGITAPAKGCAVGTVGELPRERTPSDHLPLVIEIPR